MPNPTAPGAELVLDPEGTQNIEPPQITPPGVGAKREAGTSILPGELTLDDDQGGIEDPASLEGTPPGEQPPAPAPPAGPVTDPDTIVLGGKTLTRDQLTDLIEKGESYTQKTQELADQRRNLEPIRQLADYLGNLPPMAQEELLALANQVDAKYTGRAPGGAAPGAPGGAAGYAPQPGMQPGFVNLPQIDEKGLSDEGKELFAYLQGTVQQQAMLIHQLNGRFSELAQAVPEMRNVLGELRGDREAMDVGTAIEDKYGVKPTPAELRALSEKHKQPNMRAAWLLENEENIAKGAFVKGREAGKEAAAKPAAPAGSGSRQVSIKANPNATADELFRAAMNGAELTEQY